MLLGGSLGIAHALPPAGTAGNVAPGSSPGEPPVSEVKGGLLASLKQAFEENPERDVVLGHFDVGTSPDTHRFYCLIDPKTGKKEPNAVAGEPEHRRDGTTRIKHPAVSPLSCADAEQKGLLITSGYAQRSGAAISTSAGGATQKPSGAPPSSPQPPSTPAPAPPAALPTQGTASAPVAADALQTEVRALFTRFVAGQNAHDRTALASVLLDSTGLVWVDSAGKPVWGHTDTLAAFAHEWQGTWKLEPQEAELRITSPEPDVAVLVTPLLITSGDPGRYPSTLPVRWQGVFVKTRSGWRIAAIFTTPLPSRQAPNGG